jgi:hypothetical protein
MSSSPTATATTATISTGATAAFKSTASTSSPRGSCGWLGRGNLCLLGLGTTSVGGLLLYFPPLRDVAFTDAINCLLEVTISILQGEDQILVCPVREQLLQHRQSIRVFLLHLTEFSFIFVCRLCDVGLCGSAATSTTSGTVAATATTGGYPATRGRRPRLNFRHVAAIKTLILQGRRNVMELEGV